MKRDILSAPFINEGLNMSTESDSLETLREIRDLLKQDSDIGIRVGPSQPIETNSN